MSRAHLAPLVPVSVVPLEAPRVVRHCPRCGEDRPFVSSDRFRVNAQKRRLDVWLVRRCAACEATWNQPVHERVSPGSLGERLEAYHQDDPEQVHRVAHDLATLRRHGRVEPATFRVDGGPVVGPCALRFELERPFSARFDRVVCVALGLSRSRLLAEVERGRIVPGLPLDRDVVDGALAWVGAMG